VWVVARHERLAGEGQTRYDWQHYIPLVQMKPGALRNGAPFVDMPARVRQLRTQLHDFIDLGYETCPYKRLSCCD